MEKFALFPTCRNDYLNANENTTIYVLSVSRVGCFSAVPCGFAILRFYSKADISMCMNIRNNKQQLVPTSALQLMYKVVCFLAALRYKVPNVLSVFTVNGYNMLMHKRR